MNKPASAPDVLPPHERPAPDAQEPAGEGTNATRPYPDPEADRRGAQEDAQSPRGPYVTGND